MIKIGRQRIDGVKLDKCEIEAKKTSIKLKYSKPFLVDGMITQDDLIRLKKIVLFIQRIKNEDEEKINESTVHQINENISNNKALKDEFKESFFKDMLDLSTHTSFFRSGYFFNGMTNSIRKIIHEIDEKLKHSNCFIDEFLRIKNDDKKIMQIPDPVLSSIFDYAGIQSMKALRQVSTKLMRSVDASTNQSFHSYSAREIFSFPYQNLTGILYKNFINVDFKNVPGILFCYDGSRFCFFRAGHPPVSLELSSYINVLKIAVFKDRFIVIKYKSKDRSKMSIKFIDMHSKKMLHFGSKHKEFDFINCFDCSGENLIIGYANGTIKSFNEKELLENSTHLEQSHDQGSSIKLFDSSVDGILVSQKNQNRIIAFSRENFKIVDIEQSEVKSVIEININAILPAENASQIEIPESIEIVSASVAVINQLVDGESKSTEIIVFCCSKKGDQNSRLAVLFDVETARFLTKMDQMWPVFINSSAENPKGYFFDNEKNLCQFSENGEIQKIFDKDQINRDKDHFSEVVERNDGKLLLVRTVKRMDGNHCDSVWILDPQTRILSKINADRNNNRNENRFLFSSVVPSKDGQFVFTVPYSPMYDKVECLSIEKK